VAETVVIVFEEGLPGFEHCKRFEFGEVEEAAPFGTLRSLDDEEISFLVVDPFLFYEEYEFDLPETATGELRLESAEPLLIRAIVTLREELESATINLVAPIAINIENKLGRQIILSNTPYSTRHQLFESSEDK
jgi:flagellar assembly factor FliW